MPPRLPSFNDFSPGLLGDLRPILMAVSMGAGSDEVVFEAWEKFLPGWNAKRLRTNIPATLRSTGLTSGRPMQLTDFGDRVQSAKSAKDAAGVFCAEIINAGSGLKLIEAIRNLQGRVEKATKVSLQVELQRLGVVDLAMTRPTTRR